MCWIGKLPTRQPMKPYCTHKRQVSMLEKIGSYNQVLHPFEGPILAGSMLAWSMGGAEKVLF